MRRTSVYLQRILSYANFILILSKGFFLLIFQLEKYSNKEKIDH